MTREKVSIILFLCLFVIGAFVFDDYGMSMDEELQRHHGIVTYRWLNRKLFDRGVFVDEGTEDLEHYNGGKYGVAMQLPLVFVEDVYQVIHHEPMSFRSIYLMRHAYLHCVFLIGLYCFYCLLCNLYDKPLLSAVGVLMIYVFGRLFADSFYNIKDLMFVSLSMVNLLFGERVLRSGRSRKWCILYAISTAFLVSSRIVGAIYPLLLIVIMAADDIIHKNKLKIEPYLIICSSYFIWLAITPASWFDPIGYSFGTAKKFSNYTPKGKILFGGISYSSRSLPADYYLRWIAISVPIVFLLFSIIGLFFFSKQLFSKKNSSAEDTIQLELLCQALGIFAITILYPMIKHSTVYNGWRHVYFLYPLIILMAVKGIFELLNKAAHKWQRTLVITLLTSSILYNGVMNVLNHPFEFMAFNPIGLVIGNNYDKDYWEAGAYNLMEWVADQVDSKVSIGDMNIVRHNIVADYNFLPDEKQSKVYIPTVDTDYLIFRNSQTRRIPPDIDGYTNIRTVYAYNMLIYAVYQKN